ncbi:hypothetical protein BZA77DRAFT_348674 [Pyronema omphalodes]|nr:hypothetical protein BZA77DRAFT_348674 [Pyronema omphalodes]
MNFVTITTTIVSRITTTVTYRPVHTEWKTETLMDVIGAGTMVAPTITETPAIKVLKRQFSKPPTEWTNTITKTTVSTAYVTETAILSDVPYSTVVATKTISISQKTSIPAAEATPSKSGRSVGAVVGGIVGGVIVFGLIIAFALILARRRKAKAEATDENKNGNNNQKNSRSGSVLLYDEKGIYPPIGSGSDRSEQNLGVRAWLADTENQSDSPIQQLQRASHPNRISTAEVAVAVSLPQPQSPVLSVFSPLSTHHHRNSSRSSNSMANSSRFMSPLTTHYNGEELFSPISACDAITPKTDSADDSIVSPCTPELHPFGIRSGTPPKLSLDFDSWETGSSKASFSIPRKPVPAKVQS